MMVQKVYTISNYNELLQDYENGLVTKEVVEAFVKGHTYDRDRAWLNLMELAREGKWDEFLEDAYFDHYNYADIFGNCFNKIPDSYNDQKYDFLLYAYSNHGDHTAAVRKCVRQARKLKEPDIPEEYKTAEYITVYRAGEEPIDKAKYRLSWSTSLDVARFFFDTYIGKHSKYLYKAKIKPDKVQAYIDNRNEKEIIQYRGVYDVELLETRITLEDYGLNDRCNVFDLRNMRNIVFKYDENQKDKSNIERAVIERNRLNDYMKSPVDFAKRFLDDDGIEKRVIFIINNDHSITVVTKQLSGDKPEVNTCNSIFFNDGRNHKFTNDAIGAWICEFLHANTFLENKDDNIVSAVYEKYGLIIQDVNGVYHLIRE